jgi:hypothetical protein
MRPLAAAVRPWHPSELARLGRNAVEDPPQAGCHGRTAAASWRISRRGWASACDVAGGRGVAAVGPPSRLRPRAGTGTSPASSQRTPWLDMSCRPRRLLRVRDRDPEGAKTPQAAWSRGRLRPRDRARPDRRSGHAQMHLRGDASVASVKTVVDARERQGRVPILASSRAIVYLDQRHSWSQARRMSAPRARQAGCQPPGLWDQRRTTRPTIDAVSSGPK